MKLRKTNKKGFTLVEILVAIVVVAILVAAVIPIVQYSNIRSAAAANAANLRNIEGKCMTEMLQNPDYYATLLDVTPEELLNISVAWWDFWYGEGYGDEYLTDRYATFTANAAGEIHLWNPIVISEVPEAKELFLDGSNNSNRVWVNEGSPMSIVISNNEIVAFYGDYDKTVFADIAEDGKFDGVIEGGEVGGNGAGSYICEAIGHNFDPTTGKCTRCGLDRGYHDCIDEVKRVGYDRYESGKDYYCDVCGMPMEHVCEYVTNCGQEYCRLCGMTKHTCADTRNNDHLCDEKKVDILQFQLVSCNRRVSECDGTVSKSEGHFCSYCGALHSYHRFRNFVCLDCGRAQHVVGEDCYDSVLDNDHRCDYTQRGVQCEGDLLTVTGHTYAYTDESNHSCLCGDVQPHTLKGHECSGCGHTTPHNYTQKSSGSKKYHQCSICKDWDWCSDNPADGSIYADHNCDVCGNSVSKHDFAPVANTTTHHCPTCNLTETCVDDDNNHACDVCRAVLEHVHKDGTDANFECDVPGCEEIVHPESCVNTSTNDYVCDVPGCEKIVHPATCKDKTGDGNHICDVPNCGKTVGACVDEKTNNSYKTDKDHKCDECGGAVGGTCLAKGNVKQSGTKQHACKHCGKTQNCSDGKDADHKCDTCDRAGLSSCDVADKKSHSCACGATSNCGDNGWTNDNGCKCNICGKTQSHSMSGHSCTRKCGYTTTCDDTNGDNICDTCSKHRYVCDCNRTTSSNGCDTTVTHSNSSCNDDNHDHDSDGTCGYVWWE